MADPLSITASIAGIIQFTAPIISYLRSVATTPSDQRAALQEIETECLVLSNALVELKHLVGEYQAAQLERSNNSSVDFSLLLQCLNECKTPLETFAGLLQSPNSTRTRRLGKRLKWPLQRQQVDRLMDSVGRCKQSITTLLSLNQSRVLANIQADRDEKLKKDIITWLSPIDVYGSLEDALAKQQGGTGAWFLQGELFNDIKGTARKHVWLYGIPGCGKTVLVASAISELQKLCQTSRGIGLAFFFISFRDSHRQTVNNILKSIVAQLCQSLDRIPLVVENIYKTNLSGPSRTCLFWILQNLTDISFKKTYLVFDALDEIADGERSHLLKILRDMMINLPNVNIIITSRREQFITNGLPLSQLEQVCLTANLVDADIQLYISHLMQEDPRFSRLPSFLQRKVEETVTAGAHGMFRWVECQIDRLRECRNANAIHNALASLPPTLDETYRRLLLAIRKEDIRFAARALACLVSAWSTLSLQQLAEAIIVEPDGNKIDDGERFMDPIDLVSLLGSLTVLDIRGGWEIVTLAHYSVREYLTSERLLDPDLASFYEYLRDPDVYFASICSTYLTLEVLRTKDFRAEYRLDTYNTTYPLFSFACSGLGHQMKKILGREEHNIIEILLANTLYDEPFLWANLNGIFFQQQDWYSAICLFASLEMHTAVMIGISRGLHPKRPLPLLNGFYKKDPMEWAIMEGDHEMVVFILEHATHDQGLSGYRIDDPLGSAVRIKDYEMVRLLLENGVQDHGDSGLKSLKSGACSPALHRAVSSPPPVLNIIELLLDKGSNINSVNLDGTVLISAVGSNIREFPTETHKLFIQLLLSAGAQLDPVYSRKDGLLYSLAGRLMVRAAWSSSPEMVQFLLEEGASCIAPIRDPSFVTSLHCFRETGSRYQGNRVAEGVEAENFYFHCNVTHSAVSHPDNGSAEKILAILISSGVDINAMDCIIGSGKDDGLHLEYCTALDSLLELVAVASSRRFGDQFGVKHKRCFQVAADRLQLLGGRILPREKVPPRIWEIIDVADVNPYVYTYYSSPRKVSTPRYGTRFGRVTEF